MTTTPIEALAKALETFIQHECDYMRINKLGDPEKQQLVINGRRALSTFRAQEGAQTEGLVEKPQPNPAWEALADAAHTAIKAEVGEPNPFDTLAMLERWKADAEPASEDGKISFSRALLDSAQDALRIALEMARTEYINGKTARLGGLQDMREMLARFVEQGGDTTTACSLRANWNPEWGDDPGAAGVAPSPSPSEPPPRSEETSAKLREAYARIIDPEEWALQDAGRGPGGAFRPGFEVFLRDSLAKADAILALQGAGE